MSPFVIIFFFAVFGLVMRTFSEKLKEKRGSSEKYQKIMSDFKNSVSVMLAPGEQVEAICGYYPCAAVTNQRLLVGDKKGVRSVSYDQIKKIKGMDYSGNRTSDPSRMFALEIKADKKYTLCNHSEGFVQVVSMLTKHIGG